MCEKQWQPEIAVSLRFFFSSKKKATSYVRDFLHLPIGIECGRLIYLSHLVIKGTIYAVSCIIGMRFMPNKAVGIKVCTVSCKEIFYM